MAARQINAPNSLALQTELEVISKRSGIKLSLAESSGDRCSLVRAHVPGVLRAMVEVGDGEAGLGAIQRIVPLCVGVGTTDERMPAGALHVSHSAIARHIGLQAALLLERLAHDASGGSALEALCVWLAAYREMYETNCASCGRGLQWDPLFRAFAPPSSNPLPQLHDERENHPRRLYHRVCCPAPL
jgi:hypothetical protein